MRKQVLKGFTMVLVVIAVAFMTAVVSANGQTARAVVANVPFEFNVGDRQLPAGRYTVQAVTSQGETLAIRNKASGSSAVRLSNPIIASRAPEKATLIFHRYGQQYFLAEVWSGGEQTGRQLFKSRAERLMENQLAGIPSKSELARNQYEIVEIVADVR